MKTFIKIVVAVLVLEMLLQAGRLALRRQSRRTRPIGMGGGVAADASGATLGMGRALGTRPLPAVARVPGECGPFSRSGEARY